LRIDLTTFAVERLAANFNVKSDPDSKTKNLYLRYLLPGVFVMGSPTYEFGRNPDRETLTPVCLTNGFYVAVYETTEDQYDRIMGVSNPSGSTLPKVNISWDTIRGGVGASPDAVPDSASVLGVLRGKVALANSTVQMAFDLPTEAQWEYACRAGTTGTFSDRNTIFRSVGNQYDNTEALNPTLSLIAWCYDGAPGTSSRRAVGSKLGNPAGLYDMHGNVWEWCLDANDSGNWADLPGKVVTEPLSLVGPSRIYRGGVYSLFPSFTRSAARWINVPYFQEATTGFRLFATGAPVSL
jgi:formylglycine-generating enzyme required for sulfatase activity